MTDDERLDDRVRRRLRTLRTERGLTLQEVADVAAMDVSTLSRLESGKRRLAIDHLPGLAQALGTSVDALLAPLVVPDPRVPLEEPLRFDGMTLWPLHHGSAAVTHRAYKVRVEASRDTPPATLGVHEGHDWMYVLGGRLRLVLGDDEHVVEPGQTVEFSTLMPHWFGAIDGPVELIAIFGPQGQRTHVRADRT